jgi:two-component system phosphate regulon sensor histidine kinase PhoR
MCFGSADSVSAYAAPGFHIKVCMMDDDDTNKSRQNQGHKILVVDDEAGIRRGCERVLRSQGYEVLVAERGERGLEILRQQPDTDLVLVDLRMPGISGFEFLLKGKEIAPETVFVMITAYATLESAVEATKCGAYDFIAKPFAPDDFLRLVNRALERVRLIRERNRLDEERRHRMLELVAEKTQFRTVIDCMADGVIVCNAEQMLVLYNPAALKILCLVRSVQMPLAVDEVLKSGDLVKMISDASTQRKRFSNEVRLNSGRGETWVRANVAPVEDRDSGRFLGTVTVLRDITEVKRVEEVKVQFMNMVAHELRAPLAAVDAYLSVLDARYVQDREKQHDIIHRSRQRIGALVDLVADFLNVARMEAGIVQREITSQQIDSVLKEVVDLMHPIANQNSIVLEAEVPDILPPILVDREELIRVFNNLVSNAIKYNKRDGRVRITAQRDGPYVKISVADTGIGISRQGLSRLFSEFFREKTDETKDITGTGLGLSIVKKIVDFYHGRVEVESEPGRGSTFTVWLPFERQSPSIGEAVQA